MKKVKVLLVGLLTLVMSLFCLVGCGEKGKYTATGFVVGNTTTELENSESYIELKSDDVAVMSISIDVPFVGTQTIAGEGTWGKGEDKGEYVITVSGIDYDITIDGSTMTLDLVVCSIVLEK